jgi:nicotinamide riboside transporter PnuC
MADSIYSFTDVPIRVMTFIGIVGAIIVCLSAAVILGFWIFGAVNVPGYTPIMLAILFTGFMNFFGLGVVGNYVWRTFENSKRRPLHIVMSKQQFNNTKNDV